MYIKNKIDVIKPELDSFADKLGFDGNYETLFWKLFYSKYKNYRWFHEGKLYIISVIPYEMMELNTDNESRFYNLNFLDEYKTNILVLGYFIIIPIIFYKIKIFNDLTQAEIFIVYVILIYLLYKIVNYIYSSYYKLRFKILKK